MKHIFIVNPAAGKCDRSVQIRSTVEAVLGSRGLDYEILVSKAPGDCTRLARQAVETGEDVRLYACGGDGTLNEVINGVVGFDNGAVTHFPGGSGNDFIRMFGETEEFKSLERLLDCKEARFDLIACEVGGKTRYAANICSMGLDARIGTQIDRYRRLPGVSGSGAYILSTVANVLKGIHKPYQVEVNGQRIVGDQTMICVCNGQYYGGGFNPVPDAQPDDGMLDVLLVQPVNLVQVAAVAGKYQKGLYKDYPNLIKHYRTDRIKILSPKVGVVNLDGEALYGREATFTIAPTKLRFFYPNGLRYRSKESNREKIGAI